MPNEFKIQWFGRHLSHEMVYFSDLRLTFIKLVIAIKEILSMLSSTFMFENNSWSMPYIAMHNYLSHWSIKKISLKLINPTVYAFLDQYQH